MNLINLTTRCYTLTCQHTTPSQEVNLNLYKFDELDCLIQGIHFTYKQNPHSECYYYKNALDDNFTISSFDFSNPYPYMVVNIGQCALFIQYCSIIIMSVFTFHPIFFYYHHVCVHSIQYSSIIIMSVKIISIYAHIFQLVQLCSFFYFSVILPHTQLHHLHMPGSGVSMLVVRSPAEYKRVCGSRHVVLI